MNKKLKIIKYVRWCKLYHVLKSQITNNLKQKVQRFMKTSAPLITWTFLFFILILILSKTFRDRSIYIEVFAELATKQHVVLNIRDERNNG